MAQIRICNRDRKVFGTDEVGWSEWSGQVHNKYEDGTPNNVADKFDFCPPCTYIMTHGKPLEEAKMLTKAETAASKGYDPDYVKWLEDQAERPIQGVLDDDVVDDLPRHDQRH